MKIESFRDLMRLAHGFEKAKVFFVANDLGLFKRIGNGRTAASLAEDLQVDVRALELLLNGLVAIGLLEKAAENYLNAPVAQEFLAGGATSRQSIFRHIHHCWPAWSDLGGVVHRGSPEQAREETILGGHDTWTRDFIMGMDDVTRELAPEVVRQLDGNGAKVLLDVGGGPGTYAAAFLDAWRELEEVRLFDLPEVLDVARQNLIKLPCRERVMLVEGDFNQAGFLAGNDVVWISQVLHSQDETGCRQLMRKAFQALNPGGRLIVHEFLLNPCKTAPLTAALFAIHMLVMTKGGRAYSGAELSAWMLEEGFVNPEVRAVSEDTAVVVATRPS